MKLLAVIPARSGSKGLKDKNIKLLNGIPLCGYTINAARESGIFEEICFSTDSAEYAEIGRKYGAQTPFLRNELLSSDTASSWDVTKDAIRYYQENGKNFDAVMLLQPTVPFRSAEDILNALKMMQERNANAVVSVTIPSHSPYWCAELPEDGNMEIYHRKIEFLVGRQRLPQQYILNGAIYLTKVDHLMTRSSIYECGCYAYIMPPERSHDIDDELDFEWCAFLLNKKSKTGTCTQLTKVENNA